ncbi:hypothetical protein QE380_000439 [Acinetobacter baylyi]|uniref:DUF3298 domain-containing protein n=1 Tax=Acinetobacter baylyi TaxID=202950 RepID=A0ABU0USK4_ACIBI|nr:RsiV family protein [Acinetobacter baylyi]MDQ1207516.1 hypothetical protein [Acinetobacter baylyi]MDR6105405.1 hypothetical protein [Acinetobacter baylyi]MDR6184384.1 hypothetical protein [Acinetobacter baylyi]
MKKTILSLTVALFLLNGCAKKDDKPPQTASKTEQTPEYHGPKDNEIPAMLAHSFAVKLEQPKICHDDKDTEGMVCTTTEVIGLKSNIDWIDQIINKEIHDHYADVFVVPSEEQKQLNQTKVEGSNHWSNSVVYRFNGQFGRYVQISKVTSEYTGGAHGISFFEDYVFDLKSKKRVTLNDIVITGKTDKLKNALWKQYEYRCNDNQMQPFIAKEDFNISNNFYINQNGGVTFEYQLYELAPYAAGPVSLELNETTDLIKSDFIPDMPTLNNE